MSWIRRFKNRKNKPYYEISGETLENIAQEYFPENEISVSKRWMDYHIDITHLRVLRRTPYEFAIDEIHTLFQTLTEFNDYYIDLNYIRQELNWLRELLEGEEMVYTLDWFLETEDRPEYHFLKYIKCYKKTFYSNPFWEGKVISGFPCDPSFSDAYFYCNGNVESVVIGSEARSRMWERFCGFSHHRIFGHQFGRVQNGKLQPLNHPRFKSREVKDKQKYDI